MHNRKMDSRKQWVPLYFAHPTSEDTEGAPQGPAYHSGYEHMWVTASEHKNGKYLWTFLIQNFFQNFEISYRYIRRYGNKIVPGIKLKVWMDLE
jgi:hypothetical protein